MNQELRDQVTKMGDDPLEEGEGFIAAHSSALANNPQLSQTRKWLDGDPVQVFNGLNAIVDALHEQLPTETNKFILMKFQDFCKDKP